MFRASSVLRFVFSYAVLVYLLGFLFGVIRTIMILPILKSNVLSTILEVPLVLGGSWYISRRLIMFFHETKIIDFSSEELLLISILSFAIFMWIEWLIANSLFNVKWEDYIHRMLKTKAGLIGFAGQVIFTIFPYLQSKWFS